MTPTNPQDDNSSLRGSSADFEAYEASILEEYMEMALAMERKYKYNGEQQRARSGAVHPSHFRGIPPTNVTSKQEDNNHWRTDRMARDNTDTVPCCQGECDREVHSIIDSFERDNVHVSSSILTSGPSTSKYTPSSMQSLENQRAQANRTSTVLIQKHDPSQHFPTPGPKSNTDNAQMDSRSESGARPTPSTLLTDERELRQNMSEVQYVSSDDSNLEDFVNDWHTERASVIVGNAAGDYGVNIVDSVRNPGRSGFTSGMNIEKRDSVGVHTENHTLTQNQVRKTLQQNQQSLGANPPSSERDIKTNILPAIPYSNWFGGIASHESTNENSSVTSQSDADRDMRLSTNRENHNLPLIQVSHTLQQNQLSLGELPISERLVQTNIVPSISYNHWLGRVRGIANQESTNENSSVRFQSHSDRDMPLTTSRENHNLTLNQGLKSLQQNQMSLGKLPSSSEPNVRTNILSTISHSNWSGSVASQESTSINFQRQADHGAQVFGNRAMHDLKWNEVYQSLQLNQQSVGDLLANSEPNARTNILPNVSYGLPVDVRGVVSPGSTNQNSSAGIQSLTNSNLSWPVEGEPFTKQTIIKAENPQLVRHSLRDSNANVPSLVPQGNPNSNAWSETVRNAEGFWKPWNSDATWPAHAILGQSTASELYASFQQPFNHVPISDPTHSICYQTSPRETKRPGVTAEDHFFEALESIGLFPAPCTDPDCPGDISRTFQEFPLPRRKSTYRGMSGSYNPDLNNQQASGLESFEGLIQDVFEIEPNQDEQRVLVRRMRNREAAKRCRKKKKEEFISLLFKRAMLIIEYHRCYHNRYPPSTMVTSNSSQLP